MIVCCNATCIGHCDYYQYIDMMQDGVGTSRVPHETYVDRYRYWYTLISIYKYEKIHIHTDVFVCAYVAWLMCSTVCMYIHVLLTYASIYMWLVEYWLSFAMECLLISIHHTNSHIYIQHKAAIHRCWASVLYSALQHRHQALSSQTGVDSYWMCV